MSSFRSERRTIAAPGTKAADCPAVADLIDFAEGRAGSADQQRIQEHLNRDACPHCRSWIDKARPPANPSPLAFAPAAAPPAPPSTPAPQRRAGLSWRREALADLAERLKQLGED